MALPRGQRSKSMPLTRGSPLAVSRRPARAEKYVLSTRRRRRRARTSPRAKHGIALHDAHRFDATLDHACDQRARELRIRCMRGEARVIVS